MWVGFQYLSRPAVAQGVRQQSELAPLEVEALGWFHITSSRPGVSWGGVFHDLEGWLWLIHAVMIPEITRVAREQTLTYKFFSCSLCIFADVPLARVSDMANPESVWEMTD